MTSPELENLVKIGQLKREPPAAGEIEGLQRSGEARLSDAARPFARDAKRIGQWGGETGTKPSAPATEKTAAARREP
jgi:hypothetical protein